MLSDKYDFDSGRVRNTQIAANIGAMLGAWVVGFSSQILGRRFAIIMACILGGLLIYPYYFVSSAGLYAAVFFEQFLIQGIFGIVPIHLIEMSPPAFKTFVVGTSYNLGVLIASSVPVIVTKIGERYPIQSDSKTQRFDYSKGMAIFLACAFIYTIVIVFLGEENMTKVVAESEPETDDEESRRDNRSSAMLHGKY